MVAIQRAGAKLKQAVRTQRSVFISYSHANVTERDDLLKFLRPVCDRLGDKPIWVDHQILQAGTRWQAEIRAGLEDADVYIVLMSQDYCASTFCMRDELGFILQKCQRGAAQVIGVALHKLTLDDFSVPVEGGGRLSLGNYQCLPQGMARSGGQERLGLVPINQWADRRDAWHEVQVQLEKALTQRAGPAGVCAATAPAPLPPPQPEPEERAQVLPYLCNRQPQAEDLWASLGQWHDDGCRRPLLVLTEGGDLDCLAEWVERMARYEFANAVPPFAVGELQFPLPQNFSWPSGVRDANDAARRLAMQWARVLGRKPVTPLAELQRAQADAMMPTLWWAEVPAELGTEVSGHGLAALAGVLAAWPDLTPQSLLVVALNLVHTGVSDGEVRVPWLAEQVQPAADRGELVLVALGALSDVSRHDLTPWSSDPVVKPFLPGHDLQRLRDQLVKPLPMRRFAEVYSRWAAGE